MAFSLAILLCTQIVLASSQLQYPFTSQVSGGGNLYSYNGNSLDACAAFNYIDTYNTFGQKLPNCPLNFRIDENFSQTVLQTITVLNGSVVNQTGNIKLAINTHISNSNVDLEYVPYLGGKSESPFRSYDASLNLGTDCIPALSVPITVFLGGGIVGDLADLYASEEISSELSSTVISKIANFISISGQVCSQASIIEGVNGQGFSSIPNISWTSSGTQYLNFNFTGQSDVETLSFNPITRQNLSVAVGVGISYLNAFANPISHPIGDFSNFKGTPFNLSWYKVTIVQSGTGGTMSPSAGTRWYVQNYVIHINATPYSSNSFQGITVSSGGLFGQSKTYNQTSINYNVTGPATITVNFSNPSFPEWVIAFPVVVILIILLWLLFGRNRPRYSRY